MKLTRIFTVRVNVILVDFRDANFYRLPKNLNLDMPVLPILQSLSAYVVILQVKSRS